MPIKEAILALKAALELENAKVLEVRLDEAGTLLLEKELRETCMKDKYIDILSHNVWIGGVVVMGPGGT